MILVTGGTGLVGAHLLFELLKTERKVRAIYRKESEFEGIKSIFRFLGDKYLNQYQNIEWVEADILNIPEMEKAFEGISLVYHCAALVSFTPSDFEKLIKINVEGTANIVNLCLYHKIEKLCYVSSVATLSHPTNHKPASENDYWNPETENNVYAISKNGGEIEVWRGSQEGLNVIIVNPSLIIGYGFPNKGIGILFKKIKEGLSYYPTGGTGWVYVEDVAKAMNLLMKSDIKNERFVLNGENWTFKKMLTTIAKYQKIKPPKRKIPKCILELGWRIDAFLSFFIRKKQFLTKSLACSLSNNSQYDGNKIKLKTDFTYTNLESSLKKIIEGKS